MIVDVILTIAVESVAFGAVTELQLRIAYVCLSADGALVPIGRGIYHFLIARGVFRFVPLGPIGVGTGA